MRSIGWRKRCIIAGVAGAFGLTAGSVWAAGVISPQPGLNPNGTGDLVQVAKRGPAAKSETAAQHRLRCWVGTDGTRAYGYWKC